MGHTPLLTGVYVPLVTPFDEDGGVEIEALRRLGEEVLDAGARGIAALTTTGESTALTADEARTVTAVCAEVCSERGAELIVGAGTNATRTTIERHEALASVPGVRASLAVVPYYVRPSEAAIVRHFEVVAERSPVPLVLYNIPYRTGRGLGSSALLELAANPNVAGVKQAVGGIDVETLELLARAPDDFSVLGGDDPYLFGVALLGGSGAIAASSHLCTDRFVAMIDDALAGEVVAGRRHAEALLPLSLALFAEPSPAVIKAVLHAQRRIATPDVRMPLANASAQATSAAMAAYDLAATASDSGRR